LCCYARVGRCRAGRDSRIDTIVRLGMDRLWGRKRGHAHLTHAGVHRARLRFRRDAWLDMGRPRRLRCRMMRGQSLGLGLRNSRRRGYGWRLRVHWTLRVSLGRRLGRVTRRRLCQVTCRRCS
jgi:hypothetical protein